MPTRSIHEIYARHRGPFAGLGHQTVTDAKGRTTEKTIFIAGPFTAEEAHEEFRMLINDPRDTHQTIHVFSETEQQHIGVVYKRGETYLPWEEEHDNLERLELQAGDEATLLPRGDEPVPTGHDRPAPVSDSPRGALPDAGHVPRVPRTPRAKRADKLPGDRFPVVRGRAPCLGLEEGWPKSEGAQAVKRFFSEPGVQATVAEVVAAIGPALQGFGVQFPAALISRLKQGGFLKGAE